MCALPSEIRVTPVSPVTATGTSLALVWPLPSSPSVPSPHASTVPPLSSAVLNPPPAATALTPVRPCTATGTLELVNDSS